VTSGEERTLRGMSDLEELFRRHADPVRGYARRHVGPDSADDVVSETFLIAWRRRADLPTEPLPWLLVVARNVISNQRRTGRRADELWRTAVREQWRMPQGVAPDEAVTERDAHLSALDDCTRAEREALILIAWDGLTPAQAAAVAGCSVRAFTVRLSRARARMERALRRAGADAPPGVAHRPILVPTKELS